VCETVWYFHRWILIRLTRNLSRFFLNSVEILTWNFRKTKILGEFFRNFVQTKAIIYQNLWNFAQLSAILFCVRNVLKKTHTSTFICCLHPGKEARPYANHKKKIRGRKPGSFVFGKPVLFTLDLGLTTSYSLGVLVWNFYQAFVIVSIEFWLRFENQIRPTRLEINILFIAVKAKRKVRLWVKLFDFFHGWILIRLTWNLSCFVPYSVKILTWNIRKKLFLEKFSEYFVQTKAILYQNCWNFAILSAIFILRPFRAEKIHASTFICWLYLGKEAHP